MNDSNMLWWVIAGIVVLAIVIWALSRSMSRKRDETHREEAAAIRNDAVEQERLVRERQAQADLTDAEARRAQAEADEAAARAEATRVEHERHQESLAEAREAHSAELRRADALDPDVRTDSDGFRLDEHGNRIEDDYGRGLPGTGAVAGTVGTAGAVGAGAAGATGAYAAGSRSDVGRDVDVDPMATGDRPGWSEPVESTGLGADGTRGGADRDHDGDIGLDDRVENKVDSMIGHDDPTRSNVGDGRDDNADLDLDRDRVLPDDHRLDRVDDRVEDRYDDRLDDLDGNGRRDGGFLDRAKDKLDDVRGARDSDGDGHRG